MSCQRSFWLIYLSKRDNVGHGEATINNAATIMIHNCIIIGVYVCMYTISAVTRMQRSLNVSSDTESVHKDIEDRNQNNHITETNLVKPERQNRPHREKTGFLPMQKQSNPEADQRLYFRYVTLPVTL